MELQTSREPLPKREEIIGIREKHRGKILTDSEVLDLVTSEKTEDLDSVILWLGSGIKEEERPVNRFAAILDQNFDRFSQEEQERLLTRSINYSFGFFAKSRKATYVWQDYYGRQKTDYKNVPLGDPPKSPVIFRNGCEYILRLLEFNDNDIGKTREFLSTKNFRSGSEYTGIRHQLYILYLQKNQNEEMSEEHDAFKEMYKIRDAYLKQNEKIAEAAFWVDVALGGLNPKNRNFDRILNTTFNNADGAIKTQIMIYLKEQLLSRSVPRKKSVDVKRFLSDNQSLYNAVKANYPHSAFLEAYDTALMILNLDELVEKTKGKTIATDDLVTLLEEKPVLATYVTTQELENALDKTRDHGIALRIERLIRAKNTKPLKLNN